METYEQQVQRLLRGQTAPLVGGVPVVLYRCPQCNRPWLMQGPEARLDLSAEEVAHWADILHAEVADLPPATCRDCAFRLLGGQLSIDEYADEAGRIRGYGYTWESIQPVAHLQVIVVDWQWVEMMRPSRASIHIVTDASLTRAVLVWFVRSTRGPFIYQPLPPDFLVLLKAGNPPGAHAPGTKGWVWQGASWHVFCPPLSTRVLVICAQAGEKESHFRLTSALSLWRMIAEQVQNAGHGSGEA